MKLLNRWFKVVESARLESLWRLAGGDQPPHAIMIITNYKSSNHSEDNAVKLVLAAAQDSWRQISRCINAVQLYATFN